MFSNALKSFTSNITSNYVLSPAPTSQAGPWKIYDAKKKKSNQAASVFVFDRKTLDSSGAPSGGLSLRGSSSRDSIKAAQDEAVERLKKEASLLARLRHPCILELVEPVEDTRGGGLMFATEPVMSSLSVLLAEKDEEEARNHGGRFVRDDGNGGRKRREVEIDELEIQKGLLQIGKGLEFLHESAALIHGNLTPDSIMVNAKSDWKLTSFSFTVTSTNPPLPAPYDARLPPFVQLSLDYASPDLVLDQTLTPSSDLFALGLLIVALYNHPHKSPLETHHSASTYHRLLSSASTTPNAGNNYLSSRPLPRPLIETLLPRLLTRRPPGRVTAREFQQSPYFDNILVSTLRFLDSLPAKTPAEKSAFMRGLVKVLPQFPRSVLEKKILPGLVEELRDGSMLALVLPNIFTIVEHGAPRLFSEKVLTRLKEVFIPPSSSTAAPSEPKTAAAKIAERERESGREGGLTVLLANLPTIKEKTTAQEFKEDILPLHQAALESPTHALQDLALRSLPVILPKLDFPTLKNDLFPIVANVFTKTSSLGIKIRTLEAFKVLCSPSGTHSDSPELDKYTIQDRLIPLLRGIKTKEPAVSTATLDVFRVIGKTCDREVVATEILPCLWQMSFGPLLGLDQFLMFMETIRELSGKIENEQIRKLSELQTNGETGGNSAGDFLSFGGMPGAGAGIGGGGGGGDGDFENLVFGRTSNVSPSPASSAAKTGFGPSWNGNNRNNSSIINKPAEPAFSWSTTTSSHSPSPSTASAILQPSKPTTNINISSFTPLTPRPPASSTMATTSASIDWSPAAAPRWNTPPLRPASTSNMQSSGSSSSHPTILYGQTRQQPAPPMPSANAAGGGFSGFMIPPPPPPQAPPGNGNGIGTFTLTLPSTGRGMGMGTGMGTGMGMGRGRGTAGGGGQKKGLDAYESLL